MHNSNSDDTEWTIVETEACVEFIYWLNARVIFSANSFQLMMGISHGGSFQVITVVINQRGHFVLALTIEVEKKWAVKTCPIEGRPQNEWPPFFTRPIEPQPSLVVHRYRKLFNLIMHFRCSLSILWFRAVIDRHRATIFVGT